jgi:hypothetical protein
MNARLPFLFLVLLLLAPSVFGFWWLFEPQKPPFILVRENDVNGEDLNIGYMYAREIEVETLIAGTIESDANVVGDMNVGDDLLVGGDITFGGIIYGDGSGLTGVDAASGWPADTTIDSNTVAYTSIQADLNTFYCILQDSNNPSRLTYSVLADLNSHFYGKQDINSQFASILSPNFLGDANFESVEADYFYGDGSGLTGISGSGDGIVYTGISPVSVDSDANTISLVSDFNDQYWSKTDLNISDFNIDVDGGFANSVYLISQLVDGGGA